MASINKSISVLLFFLISGCFKISEEKVENINMVKGDKCPFNVTLMDYSESISPEYDHQFDTLNYEIDLCKLQISSKDGVLISLFSSNLNQPIQRISIHKGSIKFKNEDLKIGSRIFFYDTSNFNLSVDTYGFYYKLSSSISIVVDKVFNDEINVDNYLDSLLILGKKDLMEKYANKNAIIESFVVNSLSDTDIKPCKVINYWHHLPAPRYVKDR